MAFSRVLGISLGTRKVGLAVLDCYSIFDCRVKSFAGQWSNGKKRAILRVLEEYIDMYGIVQVSVKVPTLYVDAPAVAELFLEIEHLARVKNIGFCKCTLAELKKGLGLNGVINKNILMKVLLKKYSELRQEYECAIKSKVKHYEKLFEAIGAARRTIR